MKIALLVSGGLGLKCLHHIKESHAIEWVATDSGSTGIVDAAQRYGLNLFQGNPRGGKLAQFAQNSKVDLLLSINYLFLIERDVLDLATTAINFHGSLLPKYRGRTPHVWAIINNESKTGVTAHLIDEGCDTGAIVLQREVEIEKDDSGASLLEKYHVLYPEMIDEILIALKNGILEPRAQQNELATYFGKRTPEDGAIDWNWQKERIGNWVRAQRAPYPGAFTTINENKIVIDVISFVGNGFNADDSNGLVLSVDPAIVVKTPNGAIELTRIIKGVEFIKQGQILGT